MARDFKHPSIEQVVDMMREAAKEEAEQQIDDYVINIAFYKILFWLNNKEKEEGKVLENMDWGKLKIEFEANYTRA